MKDVYKKCKECGAKFLSINQRTTCSPECKKRWKKRMDAKCRKGLGKVGSTQTCPVCKQKFTQTGAVQIYCSVKCNRRARDQRGVDKVLDVPSTCVICGVDFMTSKQSKAVTCCPEHAIELRRRKVAEHNANEKQRFVEQVIRYCAPFTCQWDKMTTSNMEYPRMDCPQNDPLTNRMESGVWVNVRDIREVAA